MITNEILTSLDEVEEVTLESMISVCKALCDEYEKGAVIMEECCYSSSDYSIFQEGAISDEMKDMAKGQNTLVRILTLIPRLIIAIFRTIKKKFSSNSERIGDTVVDFGDATETMTAEVKKGLFHKSSKEQRKKSMIKWLGVLGGAAAVGGGIYAGKKIHDKKKAEDEEASKPQPSATHATTKPVVTNTEEPPKKPEGEEGTENVPPKAKKALAALDSLEEFYNKYVTSAKKNNVPIIYENDKIYIEEGISKVVDKILSAVDDLYKLINGANPKKIAVRYSNVAFTDIFTKDEPEACAKKVEASIKKFESNETKIIKSLEDAKTRANGILEMNKDERKALGEREASTRRLAVTIGSQIAGLCETFTRNIELWNKTVIVIQKVNDCYSIEEKNTDYKVKLKSAETKKNETEEEKSNEEE